MTLPRDAGLREVEQTRPAALGWGGGRVLPVPGPFPGARGGRGGWPGQVGLAADSCSCSPLGQGPLKGNPREAVPPFLLFSKCQRHGQMKHVKNAKERNYSQIPENSEALYVFVPTTRIRSHFQ